MRVRTSLADESWKMIGVSMAVPAIGVLRIDPAGHASPVRTFVSYARSCSSSMPTRERAWIASAVRTPTTT